MGVCFYMSAKDKEKWNRKYGVDEYMGGKTACDWLTDNTEVLTGTGRALDIAMGEGRNSIYLAQLGFEVTGIDVSDVGVKKARALAEEKNIELNTIIADLDDYKFKEESFDLAVCFNFLDRKLFPKIREILCPGGLIIYETFSIDFLKYSSFKKEWVLGEGELLKEFQGYRILRYREVDNGQKGFASIIAQKPLRD
jgi:tellurite methyltransferase